LGTCPARLRKEITFAIFQISKNIYVLSKVQVKFLHIYTKSLNKELRLSLG